MELPFLGASSSVWVLFVSIVVLMLLRPLLRAVMGDNDAINAWLTEFVSISLMSLPFVVAGALAAAALRIVATDRGWSRKATERIEAFDASLNPVVVASTAVAFVGDWRVVGARVVATLLTTVVLRWIWSSLGVEVTRRMPRAPGPEEGRLAFVVDGVQREVFGVGALVVAGAAGSATLQVLAPGGLIEVLSGNQVLAVLFLASLAVLIAGSQVANAFVAASLTAFPLTARLALMVLGPVVREQVMAIRSQGEDRRAKASYVAIAFGVATMLSVLVGAVLP